RERPLLILLGCFAYTRQPAWPLSRLGVRHGLGFCVFSLACGLPSTTSAGDGSHLFGCLVGTTPQYDSPLPCMRDLLLIAFSLRSASLLAGSNGVSRFSRIEFLCMLGVSDSAGPVPRSRLARVAVLPSEGPTS